MTTVNLNTRVNKVARQMANADTPSFTFNCTKDITKALEETFNRVANGKMEANAGKALAQLAGIALKSMQANQLEQVLEEMEEFKRILAQQQASRVPCSAIPPGLPPAEEDEHGLVSDLETRNDAGDFSPENDHGDIATEVLPLFKDV